MTLTVNAFSANKAGMTGLDKVCIICDLGRVDNFNLTINLLNFFDRQYIDKWGRGVIKKITEWGRKRFLAERESKTAGRDCRSNGKSRQ